MNSQHILLFEDFESADFASKGWYDAFPDHRTTAEYKNGSHAYEGHFIPGATSPGGGRHLFSETEKLYISYWVKYSSNWIGSGVPYHPHEWNILTNEDWEYQGPADTYLTAYVEQNAGKPLLALQDSKNVDANCVLLNNNSFVGCNGDFATYPFTELRSACSCNGISGELDKRDCFSSPGSTTGYYSSRSWHADSIYFRNTPGPYYKNDWHKIEAYFELNSIDNGIGIPNGKIRYWYDGQLLISSDSILMRTGAHPDMKFNQLLYGSYIGVGSPVDQSWWIDDLTLADGLPITSIPEQPGTNGGFKIYPNPTQGIVKVSLRGNDKYARLEIYDAYGKLEFKQTLHADDDILSLQLNNGIHFCRLLYANGRSGFEKIVVQQ